MFRASRLSFYVAAVASLMVFGMEVRISLVYGFWVGCYSMGYVCLLCVVVECGKERIFDAVNLNSVCVPQWCAFVLRLVGWSADWLLA